jgi:trans-2-enoyl-CoA reductase
MVRGLATATFSKAGPPSQVVTLGKDVVGKALGENEVALRFLAAPVTATDLGTIQGKLPVPSLPAVPGSEGVAVVTEVGSKVSGLAPNDWVVPTTATMGEYTETGHHQELYILFVGHVCILGKVTMAKQNVCVGPLVQHEGIMCLCVCQDYDSGAYQF